MATIQELETRAADTEAAEAAALYALAEGMRELAVQLPDGSHLAVALAKEARALERTSTWTNCGNWGATSIRIFVTKVWNERMPEEED